MSLLEDLFGLKGRTALVTGGGTGIGRIIAEALAAAGASVLIASRKADACEVAAQEINDRYGLRSVQGFAGNVGSEEGVAALAASVRERADRLHILINNAGKGWMADSLDSFPYRGWKSVLRVNVTGAFALTQQLLPMLEGAATSDSGAWRGLGFSGVGKGLSKTIPRRCVGPPSRIRHHLRMKPLAKGTARAGRCKPSR